MDATLDQHSLPLGYAFPGHEPDPTAACDSQMCHNKNDFDKDTFRLTCGHTFHKGCILEQKDNMDHSYSMTEVKCPICYPLLQQRMEELALTFNK